MNKMFYPKLSVQNIIKNGRFYIPFCLSAVLTVMMFFNIVSLYLSPSQSGHDSVTSLLYFGIYVIGLFAVIFLFYTNSFLMKRRSKEIGLYSILGMEKRHIAKLFSWETLITASLCILFGLLLGILFNKLVFLILMKIESLSGTLEYFFVPKALLITVILFYGIFGLILLYNLSRIVLSKPVELLSGGNVGEKEPKAKWVLAIIGIICLGIAYYIAVTTTDVSSAILLFFLAVVLVIIGTYCLFTAGSIVVLKLLKKNRSFYYKPRNFATVSGMLYRMKQNAVGLANICILSTMVLVMLSSTICLYAGVEDIIAVRFPRDVVLETDLRYDCGIKEHCYELAKKHNLEISDFRECRESLDVMLEQVSDSEFRSEQDNAIGTATYSVINFVPLSSYNSQTGRDVSLQDDEIILCAFDRDLSDTFSMFGKDFTVKEHISDFYSNNEIIASASTRYTMIFSDECFDKICGFYEGVADISYNMMFNLNGSEDDKEAFNDEFLDDIFSFKSPDDDGIMYNINDRSLGIAETKSMFGGLLFLGIFLGILFIMATVLIIYYKQLSEGYDDCDKFRIMQNVGMDKDEVKRTISTQLLVMFFLPLAGAIVHLCFAFSIIKHMLAAFWMYNVPLFAACTAICIGVYALVYAIVYLLTARSYYKIVT